MVDCKDDVKLGAVGFEVDMVSLVRFGTEVDADNEDEEE